MNKLKTFLLTTAIVLMANYALAAGPAIEDGNMIQFTAADQETTVVFTIKTIVWISAAGSEIGADHGFLLEDGSGAVIIGAEATAVSDQFIISIPDGIVVSGLKAEDLDAGYLYIYGSRR